MRHCRLVEILGNIGKLRVALIGDLCLDVYWHADMTRSELSRETPHYPLPVVEERMSPGGGGNTAANLSDLKPASVKVFGVLGNDWRGDVLIRLLQNSGIDTANLVRNGMLVTNAYCKPLRKGISETVYEDSRIDFCNYAVLPGEVEEELQARLEECIGAIDILCVSDQLSFGCITPAVRERIIRYSEQGLRVVVDSRDRIGLYRNATLKQRNITLKPNEVEGMKATCADFTGAATPADFTGVASRTDFTGAASFGEYAEAAGILASRSGSNFCMTLGSKGCALAAGAEPVEACFMANLAASVTKRKIGMTGTANPEEIRLRLEEMLSFSLN